MKTTNLGQEVFRFLTVDQSVKEMYFYMPIEILKQRPVKMETRMLFAILILLNFRVIPRDVTLITVMICLLFFATPFPSNRLFSSHETKLFWSSCAFPSRQFFNQQFYAKRFFKLCHLLVSCRQR